MPPSGGTNRPFSVARYNGATSAARGAFKRGVGGDFGGRTFGGRCRGGGISMEADGPAPEKYFDGRSTDVGGHRRTLWRLLATATGDPAAREDLGHGIVHNGGGVAVP